MHDHVRSLFTLLISGVTSERENANSHANYKYHCIISIKYIISFIVMLDILLRINC